MARPPPGVVQEDGFGELEIFVSADLDGCGQREQGLEGEESGEYAEGDGRIRIKIRITSRKTLHGRPAFVWGQAARGESFTIRIKAQMESGVGRLPPHL